MPNYISKKHLICIGMLELITDVRSFMKIEIWSDFVCPFCYIGKRRLERALSEFPQATQVHVEWKSFQLAPERVTDLNKTYAQMLAEKKNMPLHQVQERLASVAEMGISEGLHLCFDKAIVVNTFLAHRFAYFAKMHSKQQIAQELLFEAYFTKGKNIDYIETLAQIGEQIGIRAAEVRTLLMSETFKEQVQREQQQAHSIGVRSVPFFLFNNRYAVVGAQESHVLLAMLQQTFNEWEQRQASATATSCSIENDTCN
ncbi:MAG: DsbA family oxidoreductase [Cytophagales bacterium]|nr:DsbA family oxidoreductase [Bernardetiaceae bacterium]MDW8204252.1 DsbA family oxidoreductase [Cytophagales bacterium]